eukprot:15998084-Heterocapsa_arctica.AAC.1
MEEGMSTVVWANKLHGTVQKQRARITMRRAWRRMIRADCGPTLQAEWADAMPPAFQELTDDYELAVLMLWTWIDRITAPRHILFPPNMETMIFDPSWL